MISSTVDPVTYAEALVGLPVATVVVAVVLVLGLALHRRILVLGRELVQIEESSTSKFDALVESHGREMAQLAEARETMREERDWWRDTAVRALDLGERAVASSGSRG